MNPHNSEQYQARIQPDHQAMKPQKTIVLIQVQTIQLKPKELVGHRKEIQFNTVRQHVPIQ